MLGLVLKTRLDTNIIYVNSNGKKLHDFSTHPFLSLSHSTKLLFMLSFNFVGSTQ